jgi:hypothetical protein
LANFIGRTLFLDYLHFLIISTELRRFQKIWRTAVRTFPRISIDLHAFSFDNPPMITEALQNELMDDLKAVADAVSARRPVDPAVVARVRERSRNAQKELLKKHGVREIAVELIRVGRDE